MRLMVAAVAAVALLLQWLLLLLQECGCCCCCCCRRCHRMVVGLRHFRKSSRNGEEGLLQWLTQLLHPR